MKVWVVYDCLLENVVSVHATEKLALEAIDRVLIGKTKYNEDNIWKHFSEEDRYYFQWEEFEVEYV